MMKISMPYYKSKIKISIDDKRINGVLVAKEEKNDIAEKEIVKQAIINPISSDRLCDMANGLKSCLVITSDHTRPVPSKIIMPLLLEELRSKNPDIDVKIIIATGSHRVSTNDELVYKFGKEIVKNENIVMHNSTNMKDMVYKGKMPSDLELYLNKLIDEVDLVIAEGFIEPHFFAGFSGGRKSILPGIAYYKSVLENHCSVFLDNPDSRTGNLEGNPIHEDMLHAAKAGKLAYILNVTMDDEKRITHAFAGDPIIAHERGCAIVSKTSGVKAIKSDVVVTSNGGYPLDQNVYQMVKGLTAAEACANEDGIIIIFSSCSDGHGGQDFYETFKHNESADDIMNMILSTNREDTIPDQWESQMLARVQMKCKVIVISTHIDSNIINDMHMMQAKSFEEALEMADDILGKKSKITVIPDGVNIIVI